MDNSQFVHDAPGMPGTHAGGLPQVSSMGLQPLRGFLRAAPNISEDHRVRSLARLKGMCLMNVYSVVKELLDECRTFRFGSPRLFIHEKYLHIFSMLIVY